MRRLALPRWSRLTAILVCAAAVLAFAGWEDIRALGPNPTIDAAAYEGYAGYLSRYHHIPPVAENYEAHAPPLYEVVGAGAEWITRRAPSRAIVIGGEAALTDALWLVLVGSAAALMTAISPWKRDAALGLFGLAALWTLDDAFALARKQPWSSGRLLSLAETIALVTVVGLTALELWPRRPAPALGVAGFALGYPVVFRMGVLFHPEATLALLSALALLLVLRAERRNWPARYGLAAGVLCAAGALTRQSAIIVITALFIVVAVAAGRSAVRFLAAFVSAIAIVAGPWWGFAYHAWGNPLQGNLQRTSAFMVHGGEPVSFFVSFPIRQLIEHPYRPAFANQFWPQLHADLWSDWFGSLHGYWSKQPHLAKVTASTQSALGFVADMLGLAGLAAFGVPAMTRVVRRRQRECDFGFALLAFLALLGVAGLLAQIVRYPQIEGDEIKASYLLFTTPCWAVLSLAAWNAARRRSRIAAALLPGWAALYALSYATSLYALFA